MAGLDCASEAVMHALIMRTGCAAPFSTLNGDSSEDQVKKEQEVMHDDPTNARRLEGEGGQTNDHLPVSFRPTSRYFFFSLASVGFPSGKSQPARS